MMPNEGFEERMIDELWISLRMPCYAINNM